MAALSLLAVLLASLYFSAAIPVIELYRDRAEKLAINRLLEPRLRAAAAEVPQLQARLLGLRQTESERKISLEGTSDALAAAALQSQIELLAVSAGAVIGSSDALPAEPRGSYRRVGLRFAGSASYESIIKLLGAIEKTSPPLVVDNLQLHGKPMIAGSESVTQLNAGFSVYGFRSDNTAASTQ